MSCAIATRAKASYGDPTFTVTVHIFQSFGLIFLIDGMYTFWNVEKDSQMQYRLDYLKVLERKFLKFLIGCALWTSKDRVKALSQSTFTWIRTQVL